MRYILYLFTMGLLFVGGMMVGNMYLPERAASLSAAVSAPKLNTRNPALQNTSRENIQRNLNALGSALAACPVVVNEEKDRLINQIRLRLALEDFEQKKMKLELEIAKNKEANRPTAALTQAAAEYNQARAYAEKLADELFPVPAEEPAAETPAGNDNKNAPAPNNAEAAKK